MPSWGFPGSFRSGNRICHVLPGEREPFGYRDGISFPQSKAAVFREAIHSKTPLKAGDFVLGYPGELDAVVPQPDVLGRNGFYVVFRKLYQRVAEFRRYLRDNAANPGEEELLAAKMMGRWRSGAPLALAPTADDPALGGRPYTQQRVFVPGRRSDRIYDATGIARPPNESARFRGFRRAPCIHRMIRRGTAYGPPLADGVLEDDGVDRGLMFAFVGADLVRQFEFVQKEWINKSDFLGGTGDAIRWLATISTQRLTFQSVRCAAKSKASTASSSRAAANMPSCRASARFAGWLL